MNFSEKTVKIIDACRFCWMCRHICPIGNATGQERNTSRARALALSMVIRNGAELTDDIVDNVYECALCGACTKECVTGWDPIVFAKESRLQAALLGKTPSYINKMLDNIFEMGNPYGITSLDSGLQSTIQLLKQSGTLLFLGVDARYKVQKAANDAIKLLQKAKVDFTVLENEPDSGYSLDTLIGAAEETRQQMLKAADVLNNYNKIIVFDPADAKIFLREYKEWGIDLKPEIITFTSYLLELVESGKLTPKRQSLIGVFQDPALLAREVGELEQPRKLLDFSLARKEMLLNGKDTMFAGNLIMYEYIPEVMKKVALNRWSDALSSGADVLITASPSEYAVLLETQPEMQLLSVEQLLLRACE